MRVCNERKYTRVEVLGNDLGVQHSEASDRTKRVHFLEDWNRLDLIQGMLAPTQPRTQSMRSGPGRSIRKSDRVFPSLSTEIHHKICTCHAEKF